MRIGRYEIKRIKDIPLFAEDEIMLTAEGKTAAEREQYSDNRGRILDVLNTSGRTSIAEVSEDTRIPLHRVKQAVSDLIKKGLARKAGEASPDPRDFSFDREELRK